jgi:hypothetical protein
MSDSQTFFFLFLIFGLYCPGFFLVVFWLLFSKVFLEAKRIRNGFAFVGLPILWMVFLLATLKSLEVDDFVIGIVNFLLTLIYIPVYSVVERRNAEPDPPTL